MKRLLTGLAAIGLLFALTTTSVFAATGTWQGNGYPSASCQPGTTGTMLWVWTGGTPDRPHHQRSHLHRLGPAGRRSLASDPGHQRDNYPPTSARM